MRIHFFTASFLLHGKCCAGKAPAAYFPIRFLMYSIT